MEKPSKTAKLVVSVVFAGMYAAFLVETGTLLVEFGPHRLATRLATLDAHNFIFFPVAGLLVLAAFWKPAVLLADAMARGKLRFGRPVLAALLLISVFCAGAVATSFDDTGARSLFEIKPEVLAADEGDDMRAPIAPTLTKLHILASFDDGLQPYTARCDAEWLQFSSTADEVKFCLPAGRDMSVEDCCASKRAFRQTLSTFYDQAPSSLSTVHRLVLPVKVFFLILLLLVGVLLVRYRKGLRETYGGTVDDITLGLAIGGGVMLVWPLMNASYLETTALLTGDGSSSAYTVFAPLTTLGFGVWAMLLLFFHLRSYPSQVEYAAKIGGFVVAAIGVFRYEDIIGYLTKTLGIGGGVVAIVVFAVAIAALVATLAMGVQPQAIGNSGGDADASPP